MKFPDLLAIDVRLRWCVVQEDVMKSFSDVLKAHEAKSQVYCPMCTHTVEAMVTFAGKQAKVTPGQKCAHCGSSIDAGFVFRYDRAA